MDIVSNTQEVLTKGTISSYIVIGALASVLVLALIGALKGFHRGIKRQVVRTITVAISAVAALYAAIFINGQIFSYFEGMSVSEALTAFGVSATVDGLSAPLPDIIYGIEMSTLVNILAIPVGIVVSPVVFILVFIILSAILWLFHALISSAIGFTHKKNNAVTRFLGFILGAVQGAAVGVIMLIPVISICNVTEIVVNDIGTPENDIETTIVEFYDDNVRDLAENPIISLIGSMGGDLVAEKLATVTVGGEARDVRKSTTTIISLYSAVTKLTDTDFANIDQEAKNNLHEVIDIIGEDDTVASLMASVISGLAHSMTSGELPLDSVEPFTSLINSIFEVLETTTADTVKGDLTTMTNVLFILSDADVLSFNNTDAVDRLIEKDADGKTVVNKVVDEFNKNDRTKGLVTYLTKTTISLMMNSTVENSSSGVNIDEHYDELKSGMNSITTLKKDDFATEEEYHGAVVENLNTTLADSGIEIEADIVDSMATYIEDNHAEKGELSDEEFNDILLNYYDSYIEYQQTGKIPPELDKNGNGILDSEEDNGTEEEGAEE